MKNKSCKPKEVFISEGKFAGMFGWNLTHTPIGGLMGLPGGQVRLPNLSFNRPEIFPFVFLEVNREGLMLK